MLRWPLLLFCLGASFTHVAAAGNDGCFQRLPAETSRALGAAPDNAWTSRADAAAVGRLALALPRLDATLTLLVAGEVGAPASRLSLRSSDGSRELKLSLRAEPGNDWCAYTWTMPAAWRGQSATLIAEDDSRTGGLGVALPAATAGPALGPWFVLLQAALAALITVLPFGTAFELLRPRHGRDRVLHLTLSLIAAGLFALVVFFAFFLAHWLGLAALCAGAAAGAWAALRVARTRDGSAPRVLLAGIGGTIAVTALLFLYGGAQSAGGVPAGRYDLNLPPDNHIPELFAEKIYTGAPLRPFLADWLTSDRPPLQTGILLFSRPLLPESPARIAAGIAAQLAVFVGLLALLEAMRLPRVTALLVLWLCATSGFFLLNTLYTWPKLLPAAYLLAAAALLFRLGRDRPPTRHEAVAIGACAALAMLGHGGSFFALAGLGLVHLLRGNWRHVRPLGWAVAAAAVIYLPWAAYQKFADPPGDRLLKYHLAAHTAIDPRGSLAVIAAAYRQTSAAQILHNKWSNVRVLAGDFTHLLPSVGHALRELADGRGREAYWRLVNAVQGGAFFHLLQSLGVLVVGLPLLWSGRHRTPEHAAAGRYCLLAAAASIVVWCGLMFGPEACVVHQGSYFVGAVLHVAGVLGVLTLRRAWLTPLLVAHFGLGLGVWVLSPTWNPWQQTLRPDLEGFWGATLLLSVAALAALTWSVAHRPSHDDPPAA